MISNLIRKFDLGKVFTARRTARGYVAIFHFEDDEKNDNNFRD